MYTSSHGDSDHVEPKYSTMPGTEQKPPEGNNTSASDVEQVGVWCSEVCDTSEQNATNKIFTPDMFNTIFSLFPLSPKHPIIFDTGASLVITPHLTDFVGPVSNSTNNLRLGGMANGMRISGIGFVIWGFETTKGVTLPVTTMAYHVPEANVHLLSHQRVFDLEKNKGDSYYGDHHGLYLEIQGSTICVPYNNPNSLPIGYATIEGTTPKVNLALHNVNNQNLSTGQKVLLHWHHCFGNLNLMAVQQILQGPPFLSLKFSSPSKCELHTLKCSTCEYAKGRRQVYNQSCTSNPPILIKQWVP
jgi:hypothetical protein